MEPRAALVSVEGGDCQNVAAAEPKHQASPPFSFAAMLLGLQMAGDYRDAHAGELNHSDLQDDVEDINTVVGCQEGPLARKVYVWAGCSTASSSAAVAFKQLSMKYLA